MIYRLKMKNQLIYSLSYSLKNDSVEDLQSNLDSKSDSGRKSTERLSRAEIKIRIVEVLKENPSCTYETLSKMFGILNILIKEHWRSQHEHRCL